MAPNKSLRHSFDQVAQLYDRARPHYPEALFEDIVDYAELGEDARILEIGCGTGQATLPMARRGFAVHCIELGAQLAVLARDNLSHFPRVKVINESFETTSLTANHYDLLLSATAFHWLDPAIRFKKAHRLLKAGGSLALFWHRPAMTAASRHYIDALQRVYETVVPQQARDFHPPPHPKDVTTEYAQLIPGSGLFVDLKICKHYVATEYNAKAYLELLATFSDNRALAACKRQRLFAGIEHLINNEFDGTIIRETVALLYLARRI